MCQIVFCNMMQNVFVPSSFEYARVTSKPTFKLWLLLTPPPVKNTCHIWLCNNLGDILKMLEVL